MHLPPTVRRRAQAIFKSLTLCRAHESIHASPMQTFTKNQSQARLRVFSTPYCASHKLRYVLELV